MLQPQLPQVTVGVPLRERDLEWLALSWIDQKTADDACLRRVSPTEAQEHVGLSPREGKGGILFPYIWPGDRLVRSVRVRVDQPDIEYVGDRKKEIRKYVGAPGPIGRNHLYFHPWTLPAWLSNADLPIVITEGEKKTLALWRLAWWDLPDTAELPRFLPAGLAGVWGWRGIIGRAPTSDGGHTQIRGPIPDLDHIEWNMRRVVVVFDTDVLTNNLVSNARNDLAAHLLSQRRADVYYCDLPRPSDAARKDGIDDFIAQKGPDESLKLLARARTARPRKDDAKASSADDLLGGVKEWLQTRENKLFARVVTSDGHLETLPITGRRFRSWLIAQAMNRDGRILTSNMIADLLNVATCRAEMTPVGHEVHLRVGRGGDNVYLDRGDPAWEQIEISKEGWRVTKDSPVHFRRANGTGMLPVPLGGGDFEVLRTFCNAGSDDNFILLVAWLVGSLAPRGPYPILVLQGEQGSAKSTTSRVLRSLVDPATPELRSAPENERDLMIGASSNWVLAFDNISALWKWLSNALCRLSTGSGFATRQLHSDGDEVLFEAARPIILNGIEELAVYGDLLDRALLVHLPVMRGGRRTVDEFWAEFETYRPRLVGALCTAVSAALRNLEKVHLPHYPRMADFTRWVVAATSVLPFTAEQFLTTYAGNRRESVSVSVESNCVATQLLKLMEDRFTWDGTMTDLFRSLNLKVDDLTRKERAWPTTVQQLTNRVNQVAPLLRESGVHMEKITEGKDRTRILKISKIATATSSALVRHPQDEEKLAGSGGRPS